MVVFFMIVKGSFHYLLCFNVFRVNAFFEKKIHLMPQLSPMYFRRIPFFFLVGVLATRS